MWTNSRCFAAQITPSWPPNEVKHLGSVLVFLVEQTCKQPKEVFSRKNRAHCLKAVPNYWCKIAKHCKQILLPVIVNSSTWKETNIAGTFQSISSRSLTRADENGLGNTEIGLGYRRHARVWDHIKPIIRNKIDKCSENNLKIGPLTDLHIR